MTNGKIQAVMLKNYQRDLINLEDLAMFQPDIIKVNPSMSLCRNYRDLSQLKASDMCTGLKWILFCSRHAILHILHYPSDWNREYVVVLTQYLYFFSNESVFKPVPAEMSVLLLYCFMLKLCLREETCENLCDFIEDNKYHVKEDTSDFVVYIWPHRKSGWQALYQSWCY